MGFPTATPSPRSCSAISARSSAITGGCSRMRRPGRRAPIPVVPPRADAAETLDRLSEMGFRQPLEASAAVRRWLAGAHRALKGPRRRPSRGTRSALVDHFARAENPDAALVTFDRFLGNLLRRGGSSRCCGRTPIWWPWWRRCSAPRRGSPNPRGASPGDRRADRHELSRRAAGAERLEHAIGLVAQAAPTRISSIRVRLFGQEQIFLIGARICRARFRGTGRRSLRGAGRPVIRALYARVGPTLPPFTDAYAVKRLPSLRWAGSVRARYGEFRSRPHRHLRFRRGTSEFRRQASALWRSIFCTIDPAIDQRADRADQLWRSV